MGCEVVSVYNDQTSGLLGYPQQILKDLYNRNFHAGNLLKTVPPKHPYYIHGFNQSFAQGKMYTYVLNKQQFFIYTFARFLVIRQCPVMTGGNGIGIGSMGQDKGRVKSGVGEWNMGQRTIMMEDKIVGVDVRGKLALVAVLGGRVVLWDLQFYQQKLNIKLPQTVISISSVSFSDTYIFITDTIQPHHSIYIYQIRTGKHKSSTIIPSYQPILKGISWQKTHHITATPDGIWFMNYIQKTSQVQITKGMFRIFPKTSMTCLCVVDDTYVISGSVDGYVFLWAYYQCQKVLKVGEFGVAQMMLSGNKLIVSNFGHNVRVFEYTIKKKVKMEEDQIKNGEITDDFVSVVIDSYERYPLQSIVISKLQPSIYYAQTRSGLLYNKMIPSADYQNKIKYYKEMDKKIIQFEKDTIKYIWNNQIWFIKHNKQFFEICKMPMQGQPNTWKISNRYISNAKKYVETSEWPHFCLIPVIKKVCYAGTNKIYVCDIEDIELNPDIKIDKIKQQLLFQFQPTGVNALRVHGLSSFQVKGNVYLIFFFQTQYGVFVEDGDKWKSVQTQQYQKEITKEITIDGEIVKFQQRNYMFRLINQFATHQMKDKMSFMHCVGQIQDMDRIQTGQAVSLGAGAAIVK